jgi:hypothetical protein
MFNKRAETRSRSSGPGFRVKIQCLRLQTCVDVCRLGFGQCLRLQTCVHVCRHEGETNVDAKDDIERKIKDSEGCPLCDVVRLKRQHVGHTAHSGIEESATRGLTYLKKWRVDGTLHEQDSTKCNDSTCQCLAWFRNWGAKEMI